jgi:ATP phosphoribosyltransferase regulatory subunit
MRRLFRSCSYSEIETPTLEFYDTFSCDSDLMPQETMFKFFDQQGRILVLRPDITIPVARVTATKYRDMTYPLRVSYIGNVFRYNEYGGGKQNEFTQAGVEIMGVNSPESDAEVISIAIKSLLAVGLENFQIDIGQVDFFKGLMEEAALPDEKIEKIGTLIDRKDFVGLAELLDGCKIADSLKKLILDLPGLFGSTDVIEKAEAYTLNKRSIGALENIRQVLEILDDYGLSKYVSVDLGMLKGLNYDTGIIFRGFTYGIGFPILTGGRYDKLVELFGKTCPATGFSLGINMVMMALQRQKIGTGKPETDSIICYSGTGRKTAIKLCDELRRQGLVIEMDVTGCDTEMVKKNAVERGIGGILEVMGDNLVRVHNVQTGEVKDADLNELVKG